MPPVVQQAYESGPIDQQSPPIEGPDSQTHAYSPTLGLYIPYNPLVIDEQVAEKARQLGIVLQWDDEGRICNISHQDARKLLAALDCTLLSPTQFWIVYEEAVLQGDTRLLESLTSSQAAEWLDVAFIREESGKVFMFEHPSLDQLQGGSYEGAREIEQPVARPGWFQAERNINGENSMPRQVVDNLHHLDASSSSPVWKYWSTFKVGTLVGGIRGYVTSSGTPSFDLDIPLESRQPALTVRACRKSLPMQALSSEILTRASRLRDAWITTTVSQPGMKDPLPHEAFYVSREELFSFVHDMAGMLTGVSDQVAAGIREMCLDALGALHGQALARSDDDSVAAVKCNARLLVPPACPCTLEDLTAFVADAPSALERVLREGQRVVFVMGHANPDTDTVVSALFEAYRNSQIDPTTTYIPILQAERMPDEIRRLLGEEITNHFMTWEDPLYLQAKASGTPRWILVDHNVSQVQRFAIRIIDHHTLSEIAAKRGVLTTWEMMGSCSAQIVQKFFGCDISLDRACARMLYLATLMDTEKRVDHKMTFRDQLIMDQLKITGQVTEDSEPYHDLMSYLLSTNDIRALFARDYKEDWGLFGFAVAKVRNVLGSDGEVLKPEIISGLLSEARRNNADKNFPLTIVKLVDYRDDCETVGRERLYFVFHGQVDPHFRQTTLLVAERVITHQLGVGTHVRPISEGLEFWGTGEQLSRKVAAPLFGVVVEAFSRFFHSESLGQHVSREFLHIDRQVAAAAERCGIKLYTDREGRIARISFKEAKKLTEALGFELLSLPEYWELYQEALARHDRQLVSHLTAPGFVEFLDTVVVDRTSLIHHPVPENDGRFIGTALQVTIPVAEPGLIHPDSIDPRTGLPQEILSPDRYERADLWRYWSPDAPLCIPTRGHIFLLNQPALDLKVHPDDAFANLGIRVCCTKLTPPKVEIDNRGGELVVRIVTIDDQETSR